MATMNYYWLIILLFVPFALASQFSFIPQVSYETIIVKEDIVPDITNTFIIYNKPFPSQSLVFGIKGYKPVAEKYGMGIQISYGKYKIQGEPSTGSLIADQFGFQRFQIHPSFSLSPSSKFTISMGPDFRFLTGHFLRFPNSIEERPALNNIQIGLSGSIEYSFYKSGVFINFMKGIFYFDNSLYNGYISIHESLAIGVFYKFTLD